MNIEFCEENSGTSKKMRYFRKNKGGGGRAPRHFKVDPPLRSVPSVSFEQPTAMENIENVSDRELFSELFMTL